MTRDDYTKETLMKCPECGKLMWIMDGDRMCSECLEREYSDDDERHTDRSEHP